MRKEEWDFPPERHFYREAEIFPPPKTGWASPTTTKIVNIYWRAVVLLFKIIIATACAILLFGSLWLLTALVTL